MENYFVDVGQGSCNVILLGGRRAIVIDCGRRSEEVLDLLASNRINYLECLAVSHNDADHVGAAADVLAHFRRAIGRIAFVRDHKFFNTKFWEKIDEHLKLGDLSIEQLVRLERPDRPRLLFHDPHTHLSLKIFAPSSGENLIAESRDRSNDTSAVLVLSLGRVRIVYAGDSTVNEWESIRSARGGRVFHCDILTVPHHGGKVHRKPAELDTLYSHCVRPNNAIVSVGTGNSYRHPLQEVMRALSTVGCKTLCTQITGKCCRDLERFRSEGLPKLFPGRSVASPDQDRRGKSRNVACAGTVRVILHPDGIDIPRLEKHQALLDKSFGDSPSAMCRRFVSSPVTPPGDDSSLPRQSAGDS